MTPEAIRAAAAARRAAKERVQAPQSAEAELQDLMRQTPAGQGQVTQQSNDPDFNDLVPGDPTPITTILDNVVGLDNGVMSTGEKIGTALNNAGESLTLGLVGDEASAAFDAAIGVGRYEDRLSHYRENQEQFRDENPVLSFASEVAPALVPGMSGAKLVKSLTSKLGRAGAGAVLGALSGAVYGFAEGEGGAIERAKQGGGTAALGGLFGAAAPKAMDALSGVPKAVTRAFSRSQKQPTLTALKSAKRVAYRAVDASGETFSGDDMTRLHQTVSDAFDAGHYVEEVDNASRAVLKVLERRSGKDTTLSQLDGIRQSMWARYRSAKDQPQILDAIKALDDVIEERAGASELMGAARAANSRFAKYQLLDDAFQKAADQTASTGSGGNILNKYRQAVTGIVNNPNKARWFSQEELGVMREFIHGSVSENALRKIGKLSPNGNGLMMALHVFGGIQTGGATLPVMVAGSGAKSLADRSAMKGAEKVKSMLAGGKVPDVPRLTAAQGGAVTAATTRLDDATRYLRGK